jgi:hypothetical protein
LAKNEIIELSIVAQNIAAITEVMQEYSCSVQEDKARDALVNCMGVFNILEWLKAYSFQVVRNRETPCYWARPGLSQNRVRSAQSISFRTGSLFCPIQIQQDPLL